MPRSFRFNNRILKKRRRLLRQNQTVHEEVMWANLANRRMKGYKFRRQYSIDYMIVDFYCPKLKLAIELDGAQHSSPEYRAHDEFRDEYLMHEFGIFVIRIMNSEIDKDICAVLNRIEQVIENLDRTTDLQEPPKSSPTVLRQSGKLVKEDLIRPL